MIIAADELCPSCRKVPGINNMTLEDTINFINNSRGIFKESDDDINAMIFSCLKVGCENCRDLVFNRLPSWMKR